MHFVGEGVKRSTQLFLNGALSFPRPSGSLFVEAATLRKLDTFVKFLRDKDGYASVRSLALGKVGPFRAADMKRLDS